MHANNSSNRLLQSDERLFQIVEALATEGESGVTDLAAMTGIPKSTVHSHLSSLFEMGYATKDSSGMYQLSLRFLSLGIPLRDQRLVYQVAKPKVDEIAAKTGEKAWCMIEERGKGIFIYEARGENALQTDTYVGQHTRMTQLAAGKAILAFLPQVQVEEILKSPFEDSIPKNIYSELEQIREQGVAYNREEFIKSVNGVGAPIIDNSERVHGALSISGPSNRLTDDRMKSDLSELLLGMTNEIGVNLSYI